MSNLQSYFIAGPENLLPNHIYKSEKPNNALVRIVSELAENGLDVFQSVSYTHLTLPTR